MAMGGMFLAFAAAEWVNAQLWTGRSGASGFFVRGLTFCLFGAISISITSARPIRVALIEQRRAIDRHEAELRTRSDRHRLVGRLQSAFDMAESDRDAFKVVGDALAVVAPQSPAELLLADSSRAHLRRVASSSSSGAAGCGVETPWGCPAVRRSRTLAFESSAELDSCPRLAEHSLAEHSLADHDGEPISAMCVPVTVLGTPMGVLHMTGKVDHPPWDSQRADAEVLAEQAGSRIGVLRAMAASQLQATTDPLTGLLNRRSLEAELQAMRDQGTEFAVAFLDLDHFKDLNDTFGHEAGDRALRSFARVLRRTVRSEDIVCRYGGEEFVVVMPGSTAEESEGLFQRVSDELASVVSSGEVSPFTVSVGLADSLASLDTTEVVRLADAAMFRAKQAGRNRITVAEPVLDGPAGAVEAVETVDAAVSSRS
jgi:diguanylate cyclase (GGDEF)-like protein